MAELADAPDLGSGVFDVQVRLLLSAPELSPRKDVLRRKPQDIFSSQGFKDKAPAFFMSKINQK